MICEHNERTSLLENKGKKRSNRRGRERETLGGIGEIMEMTEEVVNRACEMSMKAHKVCNESERYYYVYEEVSHSSSSGSSLFAFPGSWSVSDWFSRSPFGETMVDLSRFPCIRSIGNKETAIVNEAFLAKFEATLQNSELANQVDKAVKENKQVIFAGHSSGGPLAMFTTLWFLEKYTRKNCNTTPQCVTFGSPLVGDRILPHAVRREKWSRYFINFVMRYDIVPLIMLAPLSSIEQELPRILDFHNPKSTFFKRAIVSDSREASSFYINVLTKASSVASHAACNYIGRKNLLVGNFSRFVELSPYRPFGKYIFCTYSRKMVVVENPDAVLQMLFHFSQLSTYAEVSNVASRKLNENFVYENVLRQCLETQNIVHLDSLRDEAEETKMTLNDLGLYARARLCLHDAKQTEKKKLQNEKNINKEEIKNILRDVEGYRRDCELRKVGYYDAFKIHSGEKDFKANVARLRSADIWGDIVDMLKNGELPDEFEGKQEWIDLGTEFRRLVEPLDVANYYRHGRNDDAGSYLGKGRPRSYRYSQRWHEHNERMTKFEDISESSFWGEVEELKIDGKKKSYEYMKDRIEVLEEQVWHWHTSNVLGEDVFLDESTFAQWWKSLPQRHKLDSCIRELFSENIRNAAM